MRLPLLPSGAALRISQADGVLGGAIWPAAHTLCRHLENEWKRGMLSSSDKILELGSGTGAVGLYAAGLGLNVTLTEHRPPLAAVLSSVAYNVDGTMDYDLLESSDVGDTSSIVSEPPRSNVLLDLLAKNVEQNQEYFAQSPSVIELDWGNKQHAERILQAESNPKSSAFDVLIGSDLTYMTQMHDALASTIRYLLKTSDDNTQQTSRCVIAHQPRLLTLNGQDPQLQSFSTAVLRAGLTVKEIQSCKSSTNEVDQEEIPEFSTVWESIKRATSSFRAKVKLLEIRHATTKEGDNKHNDSIDDVLWLPKSSTS